METSVNNKCKTFTSLEQSKKLSKILPLESADMSYSLNFDSEIYEISTTPYKSWIVPKYAQPDKGFGQVIPCWSLATLLQTLPLEIYDELDDYDYKLEIDMINKMPRYVILGDIYHSTFPYDFEKNTLLDNVVESIIWLHEQNLL